MRALFSDLPRLELRLPEVTSEEKLFFHGSKRRAELLTFGGGHTTSDSFLYFPEEKVALIADLVPVQSHPMVAQGNLNDWIEILKRVETLKIEKIVPGHGPVGTFSDILTMRQYLENIKTLAEQAVKEKKSLEDIAKTPQPEKYTSWRMASGFERNLKAIFEQFSKTQKS
jgi:glyoxylase-like metal-dependent hydrolase (beta-lactamase superfamily II)